MGDESEVDDIDYAKLNSTQNRKNKKAGGWQVMGFDQPIFKGIVKMGYKQPTQIQRKAIPLILDGKDVVAMSRTGSGKTAAFVIPMLQRLKKRDTRGVRTVIISPTRELALQTFKVVKELGRFTGLRCALLVGGDSLDEQFSALHEKPDILLATPGRLLHVVVEMELKLNEVKFLVFDEADRLFEMGFAEQLQDVLKRVPDGRQTLLFSATLPKILVDFAKAGLCDPTLVRLDVDTKLSEKLKMMFVTCRVSEKLNALLFLCRWTVQTKQQTIVFCATMKHVEYVVSILREASLDCAFLYSQLDPTARKQNIGRFRANECYLLVVTDVAARGVDIPLLDVAINFHFPPKPKLYVHRVGRVARAGKAGISISLITPDELAYMVDMFLFLGRPMNFAGAAAKKQKYENDDDVIIGRFPENLAHLETEFLHNVHDTSIEISELFHKSENAMKKYVRTRALPSSESVRRVKQELRNITADVHPFFEQFEEQGKNHYKEKEMLQGISNWRPSATIFEIGTGGKQQPAAIMKAKRKEHQLFINGKRKAHYKTDLPESDVAEKSENDERDGNVTSDHITIDDDHEKKEDKKECEKEIAQTFDHVVTISSFISSSNSNLPNIEKKKLKRKQNSDHDRKKEEKRVHFIDYLPKDENTERGLTVEKMGSRSFDAQARQISVDISADDDKGMYREQKQKRWDRKLKKFVSADGPTPIKKIRTEEGTLLPATYKAGRYENWQKQQKVSFQEDDGEGDGSRQRFRAGSRGRGQRCSGREVFHGGDSRQPRNELKNTDQIMKGRRDRAKKANYQAHRQEENAGRKQSSGFPISNTSFRGRDSQSIRRGSRGRGFSSGNRGSFGGSRGSFSGRSRGGRGNSGGSSRGGEFRSGGKKRGGSRGRGGRC